MAIISKPHRDRRHGLRPSELYLGLWIILLAPFCSAHPKTDSITLVNGNNITCEIQSLSRGMLNAKTDSLSSISIRWQDVTRVRSEYVFEIILTDGTRLYRVLTPDPNGNLEMTGAPAVPLINVVSLTPISSRIASRFDGSFDLGYNYQKSDSTTQLNADGDVRYTTRRRSLELQLSSTLVKRDMTATTSRNQDTFILNETLSRNWFALAIGQYSSNSQLNLLQRYLVGGGAARYFIRTNRAIVYTAGGLTGSSERYAATERHNNGEVLLDAEAQVFKLYSPKLDISGFFRFWPNLTTSGRYRMDTQGTAKVEVYKNLFVSFTIFDNYDRKNPTTSTPQNDYGVTMSVGYSFNR